MYKTMFDTSLGTSLENLLFAMFLLRKTCKSVAILAIRFVSFKLIVLKYKATKLCRKIEVNIYREKCGTRGSTLYSRVKLRKNSDFVWDSWVLSRLQYIALNDMFEIAWDFTARGNSVNEKRFHRDQEKQ